MPNACKSDGSTLWRADRGGRVRNTWGTCPGAGDNPGKLGLIPHTLGWWWAGQGKAQATVLCSEGPAAYQLDGRVTAYRGDDG